METPSPNPPSNGAGEPKLKIYFLPNLLTAANLFCGFVALTKIVEADISGGRLPADQSGAGVHFAGVHLRPV